MIDRPRRQGIQDDIEQVAEVSGFEVGRCRGEDNGNDSGSESGVKVVKVRS